MKKLMLISICVMSLVFAGSAATKSSIVGQTPVKKEAPVAKNNHKKTMVKKTMVKKDEVAPVTPTKPAAPIKK